MSTTVKLPKKTEPYELYTKLKNKEVKITHYACGTCHIVRSDYGLAKRCCEPTICQYCGKDSKKKYYTICLDCERKKCYDGAETIETTDLPVCDEYGDHFFADIDEAIEHYWDIFDEDPESVPDYLFVCKVDKWMGLDIDTALEHSTEEYCIDGDPPTLKNEKELRSFVAEWNEKQDVEVWRPQYKQKINLVENCRK